MCIQEGEQMFISTCMGCCAIVLCVAPIVVNCIVQRIQCVLCVQSKTLYVGTYTYTHTQNIELQVQMDNMKKELEEKDKLLMQAK